MQSFKTIASPSSAEYEEKKSRFIAQLAPVTSEDEAVAFLDGVRSANPMARHNVYAYRLREGNRVRYSDDGEPAKTSGIPTLNVLEHAGLFDVICVTTRYFGGTLLGTGGLVRAYTKAAQDAVAAASVVEYAQCVDISVEIEYPLYDSLNHWLAEQGIQVVNCEFGAGVVVQIRVLEEEAPAVEAALVELTHGAAAISASEPGFQPLAI